MDNYFKDKGTLYQNTCIKTPQQNVIAERKHMHVLNVARALMFQCNLPIIFWNFSINHAIFLINMLQSLVINPDSPYELLHGSPSTITTS